MRHTFTPGKKDPDVDPIARFNSNYNHLHEWCVPHWLWNRSLSISKRAVSLILCHDKAKNRAKQVEKLAEIATRLRMLNNYSSLRAIVTAINQSTYTEDSVMELFRAKTEDLHKKFLSSNILLKTSGKLLSWLLTPRQDSDFCSGAHQSYRMALRNTKGACIPSLYVLS